MAAERLHGDDTTVPVLAKGKTDTGRLSSRRSKRSDPTVSSTPCRPNTRTFSRRRAAAHAEWVLVVYIATNTPMGCGGGKGRSPG